MTASPTDLPVDFAFADGLTIPRMGFGAMRLTGQPGNFGPYADPEGGVALVRRALELGVRHLDTARAYGPHENERLIRSALAGAPSGADAAFVATKGGIEKGSPDDIRRDGSPAALRRHVDESLGNLGVEAIDLYYLHGPDARVPIAESVGALEEARRAGKILRIGLSNVDSAQLDEAREVAPIAAVQNRYSPADDPDDALEALIDRTAELGIAFVAHGPLGAHPMRAGAATDPAAALGALLARSPNVLVIPGTTSVRHLEANVAALAPDRRDAPGRA